MANGVALVGSVMIILAFLCQTVFFVGPLWFKNPNNMAGLWYRCKSSINECEATALNGLEAYFKVTGSKIIYFDNIFMIGCKKGFQVFEN